MIQQVDKCPNCKKPITYKSIIIQKDKKDAFGLPVCVCGCRFICPDKEFVKGMMEWVKG